MHHVELPTDHPGFADAEYRARRDAIAKSTRGTGVVYAAEEHAVWASLARELASLHTRHACAAIRAASARVHLPQDRIPQLDDVTASIAPCTGFVLRPVAGLVPSREFLGALADGIFLSTQYIRHASRPNYTPEPDVVHELFGHAASLADPRIAELNLAIGRASIGCDERELVQIERFYWFSLEFGLVRENGVLKALGAGLLSSVAEIERACGAREVELRPFDVDAIADTPFRTDAMQDVLFVAPSIDAITRAFARALPRTQFGETNAVQHVRKIA